MPFSQATLADGFKAIAVVSDFDEAAQKWTEAFSEYLKEGEAALPGPVPFIAAAIDSTAAPPMQATLAAGLSGSASIETFANLLTVSIISFWAVMVPAPATFLAGSTGITPPTYSSLSASLQATMALNLSEKRSLEAAMDAIAADIHDATDGVGTATFPTPATVPIT